MNDLINKDSQGVVSFLKALARMLEKLEKVMDNYRPVLNGERYLSDREVSERLKISRRTLQDYRNDGRIPYFQLGGKILYRESEIENLLETNHTKRESGNSPL